MAVRCAGLALTLMLSASTVAAQNYRDVTETWRRPRSFFGINFQVAVPQGEFRDFVGTGFGLSGNLTFFLDPARHAGLRIFGSWIEYGRTTERLPLSPTLPGLLVDLTTANDIYTFGVGPEFILGSGKLRPYLHATIGTSNFATTTSAEGTNNTSPFASSTAFNDWTFAWSAGGGIGYQVSRGRRPVYLDFGLRYQSHGRTRYLREGSLSQGPGGGIVISPVESETDLLVPYFGVQIGL